MLAEATLLSLGLRMLREKRPSRALWSAFAVLAVSAVALIGCSSEADTLPSVAGGSRGSAGTLTGPCKDGFQRSCSETLAQADGVLSCWQGTQYCESGRWSACIDGELTRRPDPTIKANRPYVNRMSLSAAPVECTNNPCDPTCMWWEEDPDPDLVPTVVGSTGNPTYAGLASASVCSHDICSTGAALDATCSTCVNTVCSNASYSSCCDASNPNAWTQTCVDAAYTLCLKQPPPLGLCDFGLYATGSVVGADRASAGVAIGSNTSVTLGVDSSPSRILVNGNLSIANGNGNPIVAPNGIIATGNISVAAGNSKITGTVQAGGSVTLNSGVTVTGSVWAGTNITGQASGTINGTGYAGGTVDTVLTVTSRVNGSTHAAPVVTIPTTIPTKAVTCSTNAADNRSVSGSTSVLTLAPGNYNTVSVSNDATLVLSTQGVYTFNSLSVNTGKIKLGAAFTTVGYDVDVCNGFTLRGQSSYNEIQDSTGALLTTPAALRFYVGGSGTAVDMGPDVQFVGVLRAPNGAVNKGDRGTIKGAIWAKSMSLGTDQYATGMSEAECDALGLGDEPVVACPGQNTTPAVPPALNEPCNTGLDCQMNHRCVEPQTVGGSHSKCLEGAALSASQGDACVAKICAADPTCCSTYWTPACVAKVATVCDATCGAPSGCLHQACTTGSPLQTTCDSCINTICANPATAYCCSTTWDDTCVAAAYAQCGGGLTPDRAVPGVTLCDYAGYGKGSATALASTGAGNEATVTGGTFGGLGAVNLTNAKIYGDAFAVGSFAISTATITGKTYSEGTSAPSVSGLMGSAPIYPVTIPRPTTPTISWGTSPYVCAGGSAASGSPAPGNFGATTVAAGNTLTLAAGTYTFSSLTVNGTLALPATGQVKLIVCGTVTFGTGGKMTGLTDATALNLEIYAQNNVSLRSGNKLYGFVFSSTDVTIDQDTTSPTTLGTTLKGMVLSNNTINVKTKSKLDYDSLRSTCISKGFGTNTTSQVSSPERLCSYSVYGTTSVVTAGNQYIRGGNLGSAGTVSLGNTTNRTTVDGNVFARGNVTLTGSAVLGDVRTTGTITTSGTTAVYGTSTPPGTDKVPNPTGIPNPTFSCGSTAQNFNGTSGSIAPGSYGALTMANSANVTLSAGTYYFSSIDVQSNAKFTLPTTGVVKVYVCGQAKFGQIQTPVNLSTTSGSDWLRFQIYSSSTLNTLANPAIYISGGSSNPMYGVMIAPNGMVGLSNGSKLNGLAWGKYVQLDTSALVDSIGTAGTTCEAYAIDSSPACPISWGAPTPPSESAVCTANATGATGYKDSTCSGYDLALGLACGAQVAVCNHGTTGFTGPLDVYYFAYGDRQMSTPTPLLGAKDGTCSTASITIPAGYCTSLACALPAATAAAPYTLMVGPTSGASALSECSATYPRTLDNWTVYDGRTCTTGTGNLTHEEGYEATCEVPGTHPRWDQLTWSADVPGSSTIEFWGRTGTDATAASGASYDLIATATTANQSCSLSGPTGCPINITKALSLNTNNQDPYLDLKMVLKSSGSSAPTLKDWKVRYSCVYDE